VTRTILRLSAESFEIRDLPGDGSVDVRSAEGVHRFQAVASDLTLLRAHTRDGIELVVFAVLSERGELLGGELLDVVVTPAVEPSETSEVRDKSGVQRRRTARDEDDVDVAFERIKR